MDTPCETLRHSIQDAFVRALMKVRSLNLLLNDMYVRVADDDEASLIIYDDADTVLLTAPLDGWDEWKASVESDICLTFVNLLTETVNAPELYELFDDFDYDSPFSLMLVDENMELIAELLVIDHENIVLGDDFWEKMDKELDEFYENLMSDVRRK